MYDLTIDADYLQKHSLAPGEYEACRFRQADLSNISLAGYVFIDCEFTGCQMLNTHLSRASFQQCVFGECKMVGLHFDDCIPFLSPPVFRQCTIELCSFNGLKIPGIRFEFCKLQEADFTGANLQGADFSGTDLSGCIFERTDLQKANFSSAYHYRISPTQNKLRKARFSIHGLPGLLDEWDIKVDP